MEINKQQYAIKYAQQNSEIWIKNAKIWTKITYFNRLNPRNYAERKLRKQIGKKR